MYFSKYKGKFITPKSTEWYLKELEAPAWFWKFYFIFYNWFSEKWNCFCDDKKI